ncbi:MAG: hypothetical protein FWE59_04630 [Oscillospiraceae bacterium]|nr:hypothetical protein [Oscillospiraceae bacterium]
MPLFNKNIDPRCAYCEHGVPLPRHNEVGCAQHGVVDPSYHCRHFRYDPIKRVPPKPVKLRRDYDDADFQIY